MHTAPMPCAVTSAAVPTSRSSNTFSATAGIERDERRREERVERHAPDDERSAGSPRTNRAPSPDRAAGSTSPRGRHRRWEPERGDHREHGEEASVLISERELVAAEADHEPGERGADHAPEVPLRRRERHRAGHVLAGTRSGSIAWNAGKPMALAHPAPSTMQRDQTRARVADARGQGEQRRRRGSGTTSW